MSLCETLKNKHQLNSSNEELETSNKTEGYLSRKQCTRFYFFISIYCFTQGKKKRLNERTPRHDHRCSPSKTRAESEALSRWQPTCQVSQTPQPHGSFVSGGPCHGQESYRLCPWCNPTKKSPEVWCLETWQAKLWGHLVQSKHQGKLHLGNP